MSRDAMQAALRQYEDGHALRSILPQEAHGFEYGWNAAMRFMAQPRIPAPSIAPAKITEHSAHQPPRVSVPVAFGLLDWAESILCNAKPMDHCSQEEWDGIIKSWCDQKHGIEKPRIVSTPVHKGPDQVAERFVEDPLKRQYYVPPRHPVCKEPDAVQQRFVTDEPMITWTEADHEVMRKACEERERDLEVASECTFVEDPSRPGFLRRCYNPHGLVAFYTDTP